MSFLTWSVEPEAELLPVALVLLPTEPLCEPVLEEASGVVLLLLEDGEVLPLVEEPTEPLLCEPVLEEALGVVLLLEDGEELPLVEEPTEPLCEPVLDDASGVLLLEDGEVLLLEEEVEGDCEAEGLLELLEDPGVELVEDGLELVEDCDDCEDCEPQVELEEVELSGEVLDGVELELEEVLDCGLLLELESGVEVLPVAPVVLLLPELLPTLPVEPVCALLPAEVLGEELDCELMSLEELLLGDEDELAVFGLELELDVLGLADVLVLPEDWSADFVASPPMLFALPVPLADVAD
jgi:hypothetical protein